MRTAQEVLADAARELAPDTAANRVVPRLATGQAPPEVIAAFTLEQHHILGSDRRSFRHIAERSAGRPAVTAFFDSLVEGENAALGLLGDLTEACGLTDEAVRSYEPRAGCQVYPAYVAWMALGAEPTDVVVTLTANFAAWGTYCAVVGHALRTHYGFDDRACAFFDFFATPSPEGDRIAMAAVQCGLDDGTLTESLAHRYGRLLLAYELMFWDGLAVE
ncbi:transcriptional regulator [Streptomyces sp. NPDC049577]|uniref:transcriptional regulator n=1 Tax=Streptomyces sp. NPDC049577 TaxID=3155153 RepID=UPI00343E732F